MVANGVNRKDTTQVFDISTKQCYDLYDDLCKKFHTKNLTLCVLKALELGYIWDLTPTNYPVWKLFSLIVNYIN